VRKILFRNDWKRAARASVGDRDRHPAGRECVAGDVQRVGRRPGRVRILDGYGARTAGRDGDGLARIGFGEGAARSLGKRQRCNF